MLVGFNNLALTNAPNKKAAIEKENQTRHADVYHHELMHQRAAGSFGGAINIDKNSDGLIIGGHVPIQMPTMDLKNPEKTKRHAQIVFSAAMAPSDPSSQDYKVAAEAQSMITLANRAIHDQKTGKKLDIIG